ncbi:MAG: Gx transporter family protein [Christensenellaceae bacterium]|jgi:heptaprenyl diphosphate synthase|nr:Gx transporter family protein [Christensenellaceae bacterium]
MSAAGRAGNLRRLAAAGLLCAGSLILSFLESLLPLPFPLPGMKLGLSNAFVLLALYLYGGGMAAFVQLGKILLSCLLFAGLGALPYSLCGGLLSLGLMWLAKKTPLLSPVGVSSLGGAAHALGQVLLGALITKTPLLLLYLTLLLPTGGLAGALLGFLTAAALKRLEGKAPSP